MAKQLAIKAVRRATDGGKLQVQTNGGWMNWSMVGTDQQASVYRLPELQQYILGDEFDRDPFTSLKFLHIIGTTPEDKFDPDEDRPDAQPGGDEPGDTEGEPGDSQGEKPEPSPYVDAEGKPKFTMPSEGMGDGEGGSGCEDFSQVLTVKPEQNEAGDFMLADQEDVKLDGFDIAFMPRFMKLGEELGQAVMEQAVDVSVRNIAEACHALANDMLEHVEKVEQGLDGRIQAAIDAIPKDQGGQGAIVTVKIVTPTDVKLSEGLYHRQFPKMLKFVSMGMHPYLPGPPGTGKSHALEQVAKALEWGFGSISLGPNTPESRFWGGMTANGDFVEPTFIKGAKFAQDNPDSGFVFAVDEFDNGHPGIIATLNSAMANGWFTTPSGEFIKVGSNFVIGASANTYGTGPTAEFSGRQRMDAATLDRFVYLPWDTDTEVEKTLVHAHLADHPKGKFIADDWLKVWYATREKVASHGLKIFVTMRGAINGAKLLSADVPVKDVWNAVLGDKVPVDQRQKINPL